ncbi:MAG: hypothetical protein IPL59_15035 [Candidatus Competibacteraceae bacterium]|nr:hypothetical protein [Candidatus Competibacteraceae bacterium]MBK8755489.1 hypothetical protein [Candidatus Competibacteraceae bacterium]
MNNSTNPVIPAARAILGASEIAVIDGDIILSLEGGDACYIGRIEGREVIHATVLGKEPPKEWKSALEASLIHHAIENLCLRELHELWAFCQGYILIYPNGEISHLESGLSLRDSSCISSIRCPGPGQIDRTDYAEGWAVLNDDRTYTRLSDGVILSEEEMMEEAIRDGDWSGFYEDITDWIIEAAESFVR